MEFILDTVDLEEIKDGVDHMPIVGVTSNPSIVKKTSPEDFFGHMRKVRERKKPSRTGNFIRCRNNR